MKYVPKSLSRLSNRSLLKLNASSPTLLVVAGVVGLGATAVMAAKATRNIDPVLEEHAKARQDVKNKTLVRSEENRELTRVYARTTIDLAKIYGPTIAVGAVSAASILYGHKILRGRHLASIAAYSGLMEQMQAYRSRVAKTLGAEMEQAIYEGAHGEYKEDPNHKGEYKMEPVFDPDRIETSYLRPMFDSTNVNWTSDPVSNYLFLKGVQAHMNNILPIRGHVTLNDCYDALRIPRRKEGQRAGWVYNSDVGDNHIDFGFMVSQDPETIAFLEGRSRDVRLNFNVQGDIYDLIS